MHYQLALHKASEYLLLDFEAGNSASSNGLTRRLDWGVEQHVEGGHGSGAKDGAVCAISYFVRLQIALLTFQSRIGINVNNMP